ncbi:hypothetical protein PNK_1788 [Candidatus Protochlamydia naegleriophila]|uniref:Macro domain-containing protein n=1 Tax=Candidatus Protochlamydia naegleriophila TaxID=389348 RepID=A0A0U5ET46_9BACT|nr:macro domain-containing protein [Candidatus Protochlamydia naegleriophila]CUI17395.1 hypothetical protein PNK_1788 [Candidatus Protochlamydia naegleriophila]
MELRTICANYFSGFQELYDFKNNDASTNVIALLKAASYFTVIIPIGFGVTYGIASLCGRFSHRQELTETEQTINNQARERLNPAIRISLKPSPIHSTTPTQKTHSITTVQRPPVQTEESRVVHAYTGDLTNQEKKNVALAYNKSDTQLNISFTQAPTLAVSIRLQDMFASGAEVIVNAANTHLGGGTGIDGAIHSKGGPSYATEHKKLQTLYASNYISGHAAMIGSGALHHQNQIANVIVVAGPSGTSTPQKEDELYSCYYNSLLLAHSQKKESIAFPSISTGVFRFPKERAAHISLKAISDFIEECPNTSLKAISIHFLQSAPKEELETYEKAATYDKTAT